MNSQHLTMDKLVMLIAKTTLSFCVFYVFLFTVPIYDAFKEIGGISNIFKSKSHIVIGETSLIIETADSSFERARGLSHRKEITDGWGMLFVFEESGYHGIWMKDMNFPIDIIWLNEVKQVVTAKKNITPETYPETFEPAQEATYVLEVKSGFVEENGIKIGDQLTTF